MGAELTADERRHVEQCARCQTERTLWRRLEQERLAEHDEATVQSIAAQVRHRVESELRSTTPTAPRRRWSAPQWQALAAGLLLAASAALLLRDAPPDIGPAQPESGAYRSGSLEVEYPVGDVGGPPLEFSWKPVAGAASYEVRLMEVDRNLLWSATTSAARLPAPARIGEWAAPMKALLWEVTSHDAQGAVLARSGLARFRVVPDATPSRR